MPGHRVAEYDMSERLQGESPYVVPARVLRLGQVDPLVLQVHHGAGRLREVIHPAPAEADVRGDVVECALRQRSLARPTEVCSSAAARSISSK